METLREKKKHRTRSRLAEAALDLFEEKGFDATTLEEVAAAAEVSPRTLFRYFPTKRDLIFGEAQSYLARLLDRVRERPATEAPLLALTEAFVEFAPSIEREELLVRRMELARANPTLWRHWVVTREEWAHALAHELARRAGGQLPDSRLELTAGLAERILAQAVALWEASGGNASLVDIIREQARAATEIVAELTAV